MKKSIILFAAMSILTTASFAAKKDKKSNAVAKPVETAQIATKTPPPPPSEVKAATTTTNQNPEAMKFTNEDHNFGTIPEGPAVSYDFEFKNTGKEPIILSSVQASCGCTTPSWSKEPILPGKSSKVTATYNTQGRPGNFVKTITINSNIGTKVVKIQGVVEKAPESSAPANSNSMMKH